MNANECRQRIEDKQLSDSYLLLAKQLIDEQENETREKEAFYNILRRMHKEIMQATDNARSSVYIECVYCTQRVADKVRKTLEYNGYNVELLDPERNPIKFINLYCNDWQTFLYRIKW